MNSDTKENARDPFFTLGILGIFLGFITIIVLLTMVIVPSDMLPKGLRLREKTTPESIQVISDIQQPTEDNPPAPATETKEVTLMAVGDVMLGRTVNTAMIRRNDWKYPFLETADVLREADVLFGNLESPFGIDECPYTDEGMIFCANSQSLEGLLFAGFDVMSLANNHSLNQGSEGLTFSLNLLRTNGIEAMSFSESAILESNGLKLGFVAFDDTMTELDPQVITDAVTQIAQSTDIVITSFHWGNEYTAVPSSQQEFLAQTAVQAGSRLVIGHHPHWVQTVKEYETDSGTAVVFYSLGNFVFDQMWSSETREGMVATVKLTETGIESFETDTVTIFDYSQPKFID